MRRVSSRPAALRLALAVAVAAFVAFLLTAPWSQSAGSVETLRFVIDNPGTRSDLDEGPKGDSAGDRFFFRSTLSSGGRRVGTYLSGGTAIAKEVGQLDSSAVILRDGTIFLQGADAGREAVFPEAIVGGTGRYAGASGTATTDFTGTTNKITLRLRR